MMGHHHKGRQGLYVVRINLTTLTSIFSIASDGNSDSVVLNKPESEGIGVATSAVSLKYAILPKTPNLIHYPSGRRQTVSFEVIRARVMTCKDYYSFVAVQNEQ